jgi:hypothetical protein
MDSREVQVEQHEIEVRLRFDQVERAAAIAGLEDCDIAYRAHRAPPAGQCVSTRDRQRRVCFIRSACIYEQSVLAIPRRRSVVFRAHSMGIRTWGGTYRREMC